MMASLDVDRRAEQALALRMVVARRDGAAMVRDLAFKRHGLRIRLGHDLRECACEHAGFAAGIDRNGGLAVAGGALNHFGCELDDRLGRRSRDQKRQCGRAQHRINPTAIELCWIPAAGVMNTARGTDSMIPDPFPCRRERSTRMPRRRTVRVGSADPREALRCSDEDAKSGKSRRQSVGRPGRTEFLQRRGEADSRLGSNQIDAFRPADDDRTRSSAWAHVDIDDDDAERFAVGRQTGMRPARSAHAASR